MEVKMNRYICFYKGQRTEIEAKSHMPLYSSREFKKVRIEYFTQADAAWEAKYIK